MSYKKAGVNIDAANEMKQGFAPLLERRKVTLNKPNAFSAIIDANLKSYSDPVLVFKSEEPGSKQLIAFAHDRIESVCADLVNHLINDCIVCGATPVSIQDVIICGSLDPAIVKRSVSALAEAALAQDCFLSGGETSEQPGVLDNGRYVLSSSIVGVVERTRIVDGSKIERGDVVIALRSTGIHTNGYSLVRHLMTEDPNLASSLVEGRPFLDTILDVHACYYKCLKPLFESDLIQGAAHITGGGIKENLNRVLPATLDAELDLRAYRPHPIFHKIREAGGLSDEEMLRTFNLGVGAAIVVRPNDVESVQTVLSDHGQESFVIGNIVDGSAIVRCKGEIQWRL